MVQKPEFKNLDGSGWIEMSATMYSGAAVTAAHIGCECVATRSPQECISGASAFHTAESHALPAFISSPIVSRSLVSIVVGAALLGHGRPARRHHAPVPRLQGQRTCHSGLHQTPGHGTRALEPFGRGSGGNAASLAQHA